MAKRRKRDKDYYARWGRLDPRHSVLTPEEAGSSVEAWRDFARARTYPYLPYDPRNPATWARESDPNLVENPRFESIVDPISNKVVGSDKTQAQILKDEDDALFAGKKASREKKRAAARADRERKAAAAAVTRELEGSPYSVGEEAYLRNRLATKQAALTTNQQEQAALKAQFAERAALLKEREDRLRREAGLNMGIIDTVPPDPAQFREREGTSPTTAPSDFNLERIMEDRGMAAMQAHMAEGIDARGVGMDRTGEALDYWRQGGSPQAHALATGAGGREPIDPMGLWSGGTTEAGDDPVLGYYLPREKVALYPRKEAAAVLAAPDAVEEIDVYREGEVPEEFTFKANEERAAVPVKVQDVTPKKAVPTPGKGEVVTTKQIPTNDFEDRLGLYNISIPAFTGMAAATIANRKRLQRRRDVLRAFQGLGPKDIVWPDKMTTTEMLKLHDRKVSRMIAQAMFATNPQDRRQLSQLGNKLGVNMEQWGKMQDLLDKSRPDLAREKNELEIQSLIAKKNIGPAAAKAWEAIAYDPVTFKGEGGSEEVRLVPTSVGERKRRIDEFLAQSVPTEARAAMLAEFENLMKEDSGKTEMYVMPVMYKNTKPNKAMLNQLRIPFVERDGTGFFPNPFQGEEGKPWLMLRNFRENILPLNLGEPLVRSYVNRMRNAPGEYRGFQQAKTSDGTVPQMMLFENGNAVYGSDFSNNNTGLMAYYRSLGRLSSRYPRMTVGSADRGMQQSTTTKDTKASTIYTDLIEGANYAGTVADLTKTILQADDVHKVLGGQAGIKLAATNAVQLLGDWGTMLGIELDADTRLQMEQMSNGPATRAFNERLASLTDQALADHRIFVEDAIRDKRLTDDVGNAMLQGAKELRQQFDKEAGTGGTNFQKEAIHVGLLAISLATMGARMLSRNDRLLKDQYMTWKDRTAIHNIFTSHAKARATIEAMNRMATSMQANKFATAKAMLPAPPGIAYSGEANAWMPTSQEEDPVAKFLRLYEGRKLDQ